jgi:glycosyltransferase involved in cell wall biosynthesis
VKLNFISNLEKDLRGGGFSLRNAAAFEALSKRFDVRYYGPISPLPVITEKLASASLRRLGMRGNFSFYSRKRLQRIWNELEESGASSADILFFNGFTPWIGTQPDCPYIAWNDCSFHDYIRIYHDINNFRTRDIDRIEALEAEWLKGARAVVLRSQHFANRTIAQYGLDPTRVFSLRNFSTLDPPKIDIYAGEPLFLFMSTNFVGKNGSVVLKAFEQLHSNFPEARLAIVGDMPAEEQREPIQGVDWIGFLDPRNPSEHARKCDLLARAAMLLHPTSFDTNPAILVEAAYFGCPAISTHAYAIPEIVGHGETGWLISDPRDSNALAERMAWVFRDPEAYADMRRLARSRALEHMTLANFESDLTRIVASCVEEIRRPIGDCCSSPANL